MHLSLNLTQHLLQQQSHSAESLIIAQIMNQIVYGAKIISRAVNTAGLIDITGSTGQVNVQDEEVQKLDEFTNGIFLELFRAVPAVAAYASEELPEIISLEESGSRIGQYVVAMDPLDGSSNIDFNVSIGTIFAIFKKKNVADLVNEHTLQAENMVAAGYVLYGSSTIFVYSTGQGVHGFTLDPSIGEFLLSHEHMRVPEVGGIYSINESYSPHWSDMMREYISETKTEKDISGKAKNARYIGSLVADFHRNLLKGGIYLYPADQKHPEGKLRLAFEAFPLAFLVKQAGGKATDGNHNILDIPLKKLHQRTPLWIGSSKDVDRVHALNQ